VSVFQPPCGWTWEMLIDVWDFAYEITEDRGGMYRIERRGNGEATYTDTVDSARDLILTDYHARPAARGSWS
jgi:hypothetical protein